MLYADRVAAASILALALLTPGIAAATSLTRSFTIEAPSGTVVGDATNIASSPFQQFDPAVGTLTEVQTVFTGNGLWDSAVTAPRLDLSLVTHGLAVVVGGERVFFSPGGVPFSLGGTDRYLPELSSFVGSATAQVDLRILGNGGTFSTPSTQGSVTYVYDPQPVDLPEPASLWLAGIGLLALGMMRGKSRSAP